MRKELLEKRNDLLNEIEAIVEKAKVETRSFNEEEAAKVEEIKQLPKYKQLLEAMQKAMKEYSNKNIYDVYPLYEWYINQLLNIHYLFLLVLKVFLF